MTMSEKMGAVREQLHNGFSEHPKEEVNEEEEAGKEATGEAGTEAGKASTLPFSVATITIERRSVSS